VTAHVSRPTMRAKRVRPATRRVQWVAPATRRVVRVTSASRCLAARSSANSPGTLRCAGTPASPAGGPPHAQPARPELSSLPKLRLVARLHVDLLRVASAGCRRYR
jgi:hypothetical protein